MEMNSGTKRSNAPVFWLLFGAGGMLSALLGPVLVLVTGIAAPMGLILSPDTLSYAHVTGLAHSWIGKLFLFAAIALFLWHSGHRILHSLHDLRVHVGPSVRLACYGIPLVATLVTAYLLVIL
jgi:fumarate reductase subunit D